MLFQQLGCCSNVDKTQKLIADDLVEELGDLRFQSNALDLLMDPNPVEAHRLDEMNIFMLGNACDHESRNMRFPMDKDFRDRDSLNEAIEAYRQKQALIRQVFVWGLYYLSGVLDNPKACRAFNIAWQKGHSNGFAEVASEQNKANNIKL